MIKSLIIRPQKISDASRFFDILNNDNFIYFSVKPSSIDDEISFLKLNTKKRKNNFEYNYSLILDENIVGAIGIKINQHYSFIGELGYFLDENYWNKGIISHAVEKIEDIAFSELGLKRLEIIMATKNIGSIKVAKNNNYLLEGTMKNRLYIKGKYYDAYLYAKTV